MQPPVPQQHINKTQQPSSIRGPYRSYRNCDTKSVVEYAMKYGVVNASKHFHIPESTVSDWKTRGVPGEWKEGSRVKLRAAGGGSNTILPLDVEHLLYTWYRGLRADGLGVSRIQVLQKAQAMYNSLHREEPHTLTVGWLDSYLCRWHISMRKKTGEYKSAAQEHMRPVQDFWLLIRNLRLTEEYPLTHIGNMDQTPVWQDMVNDHTLEDEGTRTVTIRDTGSLKVRFTVILAILANGEKLPPMIIFKGKRPLHIPTAHGVVVTVQKKGWCDGEKVRMWHRLIWKRRFPTAKSMLVLDSYSAHMSNDTQTEFALLNTKAISVPPGCTAIVQPLDRSINHPFKVELRKLWHLWLNAQVAAAPEGLPLKLKKPTKDQLVQWVVQAWFRIPEDVVIRSFKSCGISNALDGSENGLCSVDFSRYL